MRCEVCGKEIKGSNYHTTADGVFICDDCFTSYNLTRCSVCGELILKTKQRCNECENKIYTNHINPYVTKPVGVFKNFRSDNTKQIKGVRYYGIEMEFNCCDSRKVWSEGDKNRLYTDKWLYNKSDSSITSGVEVVTSPMDRRSVNYLLDNMEPIFDYVKNDSAYRYNAGVHIHVTKETISIPDRYKLGMLLNNNDSISNNKDKQMMLYLSGRILSLDKVNSIDDHYYQMANTDSLKGQSTGHSVALNTKNSHTFEFRIFKSSADKDVIKSYVELVDKMMEFCHVTGISRITIGNFIDWLKLNTKNKIILGRITEFEDTIGKINKRNRIFYLDVNSLLRGIRWEEYPALIQSLNNNSNLKVAFKHYENYSNQIPKTYYGNNKELIYRLEKPIKITARNYILRNQERIKIKCA